MAHGVGWFSFLFYFIFVYLCIIISPFLFCCFRDVFSEWCFFQLANGGNFYDNSSHVLEGFLGLNKYMFVYILFISCLVHNPPAVCFTIEFSLK